MRDPLAGRPGARAGHRPELAARHPDHAPARRAGRADGRRAVSGRTGTGGAREAAACKLRACERFAGIADQLVAATGETVLLWLHHEDTFVLAAAREGTQPLRYVPRAGLRAPRCHDVPGRPLRADACRGGGAAARCLDGRHVAPGRRRRERLRGAGRPARAPRRTGRSAPRWSGRVPGCRRPGARSCRATFAAVAHSGPIDGAELDDFLGQSLVATLSYLADDGYPDHRPALVRLGRHVVLARVAARLGVGRARSARSARLARRQRVDAAAPARPGARAAGRGRRSRRRPLDRDRRASGGTLRRVRRRPRAGHRPAGADSSS